MTTAPIGTGAAPRFLDLPGLFNARDLGGRPRVAGGSTHFDRVWRSDAPIGAGRAIADALAERGVRTVLDLRTEREREAEPSPLEGDPRFRVLPVDLMAPVAAAMRSGRYAGDPLDLDAQDVAMLDLARDRLALAFEHPRDGLQDGVSLVHGTAGKDRTETLGRLETGQVEAAAGILDGA